MPVVQNFVIRLDNLCHLSSHAVIIYSVILQIRLEHSCKYKSVFHSSQGIIQKFLYIRKIINVLYRKQ